MIPIQYSNGHFLIWNSQDLIKLRKDYRIVGNLIGALPEFPRQNTKLALPVVLMCEEVRLLNKLGIVSIVQKQLNLNQSKQLYESLKKDFFTEINEKWKCERKQQIVENLDKIVQGKMKKHLATKPSETVDYEQFRKQIENNLLNSVQDIVPESINMNRFYHTSPYLEGKSVEVIEIDQLKPFSLEMLKYMVFEYFWHKGYYLTDGIKFGAHFMAYDHDPFEFHAKFVIVCCPDSDSLSHFERTLLQAYGRLGKNVRKNVLIAHYSPDSVPPSSSSEPSIEFKHIQWNPTVDLAD